MTEPSCVAQIEALLFTTEHPLSLRDLVRLLDFEAPVEGKEQREDPTASTLDADAPGEEISGKRQLLLEKIKAALQVLKTSYEADSARGFYLAEISGGYQLRTKPEFAPLLRRLEKERPYRLSRSAMEALAIVAYRQPLSRVELDDIRGVDSSSAMRTLLERGLVRVVGQSEAIGRPTLYGTTPLFLEVFSLGHLSELPPLESLTPEPGEAAERGELVKALASDAAPDWNDVLLRLSEEGSADTVLLQALEVELHKVSEVQESVAEKAFATPADTPSPEMLPDNNAPDISEALLSKPA